MMELNREQVVDAVKTLRKHGLANGGSLGYHAGWCDEVADILENALALIRELTEENTRLQTDYNELYESTTEEIKSLRAELRERPPKLIITKVSKGGS